MQGRAERANAFNSVGGADSNVGPAEAGELSRCDGRADFDLVAEVCQWKRRFAGVFQLTVLSPVKYEVKRKAAPDGRSAG
jgi:hypothetical protein